MWYVLKLIVPENEYGINDLQKREKRSSAGEVADYFCGATIINDRLASICTKTLYFYIWRLNQKYLVICEDLNKSIWLFMKPLHDLLQNC